MRREHIIEKTHLKALPAFRALKMMAGRFDCDSDYRKDNDYNHHGDNNYEFRHGIFLLEKLVSMLDL